MSHRCHTRLKFSVNNYSQTLNLRLPLSSLLSGRKSEEATIETKEKKNINEIENLGTKLA